MASLNFFQWVFSPVLLDFSMGRLQRIDAALVGQIDQVNRDITNFVLEFDIRSVFRPEDIFFRPAGPCRRGRYRVLGQRAAAGGAGSRFQSSIPV